MDMAQLKELITKLTGRSFGETLFIVSVAGIALTLIWLIAGIALSGRREAKLISRTVARSFASTENFYNSSEFTVWQNATERVSRQGTTGDNSRRQTAPQQPVYQTERAAVQQGSGNYTERIVPPGSGNLTERIAPQGSGNLTERIVPPGSGNLTERMVPQDSANLTESIDSPNTADLTQSAAPPGSGNLTERIDE